MNIKKIKAELLIGYFIRDRSIPRFSSITK